MGKNIRKVVNQPERVEIGQLRWSRFCAEWIEFPHPGSANQQLRPGEEYKVPLRGMSFWELVPPRMLGVATKLASLKLILTFDFDIGHDHSQHLLMYLLCTYVHQLPLACTT